MSPWLEAREGGVRIRVHAQPGAKRSEIAGLHGAAVKIKIHAPPVEGKANAELVRFLAGLLGVKRAQVTIEGGAAGREKTVFVAGLALDAVARALAP